MAKKKSKTDAVRESLAKELRSIIPKLDSEGLAFLVEQSRIHLYNMQVQELNKAAHAANSASSRKASIAKAKKADVSSKKTSLRIEGSETGSSYYLYYRNSNLMFSRGEMAHLVKLVNASGTDMEIRERLYNWIERERRDIFAFLPIANKFDEQLKVLVKTIKKSFKPR
ncbi:MAG: hypothetical protein FWH19_05975 [Treponema sp.]|nr:hypothetical protein [Treponema sp.]